MQQKGQITLLLQGSPSCWRHCPLGPQDRNPGAAPDTLSQYPGLTPFPQIFLTPHAPWPFLALRSSCSLPVPRFLPPHRSAPLPAPSPSPPSCLLPQRLHLLPSPPSCSPVLQGWGPCHLPSLILFPPLSPVHKGLPAG